MFLSGAFSIDFFEHFNGKNMCFGGAKELKTVEIVMKINEFEVVPRGPTGAIGKFCASNNCPGLSHHSL